MWMDGGWRFLLARHSTSPGILVGISGSRDTSTVVQARRPNDHLQEVSRAARGSSAKAPLGAFVSQGRRQQDLYVSAALPRAAADN